ncbi:DUF5810 domain-containing protein [Salinigranum salinum]|uniref:DUF5810 domain-containing protein n=1 Tax=Salinigranum salinum TaxID=1364937 RepID=UPI001260457E|nr:DUF5810 domain-containing protein [Salinigranum salinum]
MGYACPVCAEPQLDADHLADHLAFQALTHGDDHESWLDEHVPDWAAGGTDELAPRVADLAAETEYEVAFEDTTGHDHDHEGEVYDPDLQGEPHHGHGSEPPRAQSHGPGRGTTGVESGAADLDPEAREIVQNARELTREMLTATDTGADEAETEGDGDESTTRTDGDDTADETSADVDESDG